MIRGGCVIQVDAGSLTGSLGVGSEKASLEILKQNCCHIIGSDAHDDKKRNFLLSDALKIAVEILGEKAMDLVTLNPEKILKGEQIQTDVDTPIIKSETYLQKLLRRIFS